jgi:hypothetical protein
VPHHIAKRKNVELFLKQGRALRANAFQEFNGGFEVIGH